MSDMLELDGVEAGYGPMKVLHGVDLTVPCGELAVLLGTNGAGKTTTLRTITGELRPRAGRVRFEGRELTGLPPERVVRLGIGVLPEPPGVFRDMTVLDNLRVGGVALGADRATVEQRCEEMLALFPTIADRPRQLGGDLSGGEQRTLAMARALMGKPRLLLVDEASIGLSPRNVTMVFELLRGLCDSGITVWMAEQSVAALRVADRAYVMEKGRITHRAAHDELDDLHDRMTRAYLGGAGEEVHA